MFITILNRCILKKIITAVLHNHAQMFVPHTAECEYRLDYRCENKPYGVATFYLDPLIKSNKKIRELEKGGYKFRKIDK